MINSKTAVWPYWWLKQLLRANFYTKQIEDIVIKFQAQKTKCKNNFLIWNIYVSKVFEGLTFNFSRFSQTEFSVSIAFTIRLPQILQKYQKTSFTLYSLNLKEPIMANYFCLRALVTCFMCSILGIAINHFRISITLKLNTFM